jgi:hypothetical protein
VAVPFWRRLWSETETPADLRRHCVCDSKSLRAPPQTPNAWSGIAGIGRNACVRLPSVWRGLPGLCEFVRVGPRSLLVFLTSAARIGINQSGLPLSAQACRQLRRSFCRASRGSRRLRPALAYARPTPPLHLAHGPISPAPEVYGSPRAQTDPLAAGAIPDRRVPP